MTLRTTKSEGEKKSAVVHSTTQPTEYQPLEKRTQDLLPIRYLGLLQAMFIVYLVQPSILHGLVILANLLRAGNPTLRVASLIQSSKERG